MRYEVIVKHICTSRIKVTLDDTNADEAKTTAVSLIESETIDGEVDGVSIEYLDTGNDEVEAVSVKEASDPEAQ